MSMTRGAKMLMIRNESRRGGSDGRSEGGSGGRNEMRYEGGSGGRNEMGYNEMRYDMRGEGGSGGRNEMRGGYGGEMRGNYGEMREEMESRFRDRRGREHYDNGRFAPMRGEMDGGMEMGYGDMRNARNEMRGAYGEMRGEEMMGAEMRRGGSGGRSHYPFGPVPPIYEGGGEMNRIGFVVPIGRSEVGGDFRSDASYSEMGHQGGMTMMGGASGESMMLTEEMAQEWMQDLQNEDGSKGPHWTKEQIKQVMSQKGVKQDLIEFWAIMNTLYADYCSVLKRHGVNTIDFYVDLANAWLKDKDAQKGKAARYFQYIVK